MIGAQMFPELVTRCVNRIMSAVFHDARADEVVGKVNGNEIRGVELRLEVVKR